MLVRSGPVPTQVQLMKSLKCKNLQLELFPAGGDTTASGEEHDSCSTIEEMDCGNTQATIRSVSPESAPSGLKGDEDWSDNLEGIVSLLNNEPNTGSGHPTEGSEDSKTRYTDKRQNDKRRKRQTSERQTSENLNLRTTNVGII